MEYETSRSKRSKNLTPSVKKLIASRAVKNRDIPRDFLAKSLIKEIKEAGEVYPTLETAMRYISDARTADDPLSEPWTTEKCSFLMPGSDHVEHFSVFPPETIPHLLQLWRYSVHLDQVFSIRHAIWAAKLSFQLKDLDISEFWLLSFEYAHEEEFSQLSNTKMRTHHLDSSLVMDYWERELASENSNSPFDSVYHTTIVHAQDGGIMEEYINILDDYTPKNLAKYEDDPDDPYKWYNKLKRLFYLIRDLPSSSKCFPDMESRMVYLNNLSRISKLPKWKTLSPEEIKDIIIELREWTIMAKSNDEKMISSPMDDSGLDPDIHPVDIFIRLGYSTEGED